MGSLSNFLGKPKEIDLGGEKITIYPLTVKDMAIFQKDIGEDKEANAKMSVKILKLSCPGNTDDEINGLPMEIFIKLMGEINKLNGFTDERIDKIRRAIK